MFIYRENCFLRLFNGVALNVIASCTFQLSINYQLLILLAMLIKVKCFQKTTIWLWEL